MEGWENVLFHCKGLRRGAEDLGAALYSPQDEVEVGSAAASLHLCLELLLEECPQVR